MMNTGDGVPGAMTTLSATNFTIWKPRMEDILYCKDLYDPIENKGVKPKDMTDEEWKKLNRKTIGLIRQLVGHEVFHHIAQETCAYTLWSKLEGMYQSKTSRNKALLMRRLVNLKLKSGISIAEHTSEFQNLVNQLNSVELKFDDEMQALLLLSSLPDSWETLVITLSNSAPEGKVTMSMVKDALFNEEARRKEMGTANTDVDSHVYVAENRGRSSSRSRGKRWNGRGRSKSRDRSFKCYYCDEEGHIQRNCPKYKEDREKRQSHETAGVAECNDDSELLLAEAESSGTTGSDWILDSGCSFHVCGDKEKFTTYEAYDGGIVRMANNSASRVVGKGIVRFRRPDGKTLRLSGVRHVEGVKKNLISLGMLDSRGCSFSASDGILTVSRENREVLHGKKIGDLYRLVGNVVTDGATVKHEASNVRCTCGHGKRRLRRRTGRGRKNTTGLKQDEQPVPKIHVIALEKETTSIVKTGAPTGRRASFAPDVKGGDDKEPPRPTRT